MIKRHRGARRSRSSRTLAHADGDYISPTDERVRVSLGAMHVSIDDHLRVDSSTGVPGTTINAENRSGLDSRTSNPSSRSCSGRASAIDCGSTISRWIERAAPLITATDRVSRRGAANRRPGAVRARSAHARPHLRVLVLARRETRDRGNARRLRGPDLRPRPR